MLLISKLVILVTFTRVFSTIHYIVFNQSKKIVYFMPLVIAPILATYARRPATPWGTKLRPPGRCAHCGPRVQTRRRSGRPRDIHRCNTPLRATRAQCPGELHMTELQKEQLYLLIQNRQTFLLHLVLHICIRFGLYRS